MSANYSKIGKMLQVIVDDDQDPTIRSAQGGYAITDKDGDTAIGKTLAKALSEYMEMAELAIDNDDDDDE